MRRPEKDDLGTLRDAIKQQTHAMMIIHCDERYSSLSQLRRDTRVHDAIVKFVSGHQSGKSTDMGAIEVVTGYYLDYWLLQWDQHVFYQNGLLPTWMYKMWLHQRWENYNIASAFSHALPDAETTPDRASEARGIESQEFIFRYGWDKAKAYYCPLKPGFIQFSKSVDKIMRSNDLDSSANHIRKYFDTKFTVSLD